MVQTLIIRFSNVTKWSYLGQLLPRAEAVVGWLHQQHLIQQGYLTDDDFPEWVPTDL